MKKIIIGLAVIVGIGVAIGASHGSSGNSGNHGTNNNTGITTGIGSKDASGDVTLATGAPDDAGILTVPVIITNHSSKRSDYFVDLAAESADGSHQYGTTTAMSMGLDAGQTATVSGLFFDTVPAGAKIVVKSVQRTASN